MPLLERDQSLTTLRNALRSAAAGSGSMVVVAGEAGSGRTSLVRTFAAECDDTTRVLYGACDDLVTPPAFGPWFDIARTTGDPLEAALAAGAEPHVVLQAIVGEASRGPDSNLIVVEDVHWADDATLDSLRYLSRRIAELPAVVVLTYRSEELSPEHPLLGLLGQLHGEEFHRIDLQPLTELAVAELAGDSNVDATAIHRVTGGNPFFVHEVLAAPESDVPQTVRDAVLARLRRLTPEARHVIDVVAVSPGGLEESLVSGLAEGRVAALAEAEDHGILEGDERIQFHNELARRAVEESMSSAKRREVNRRVLEALRKIDADGARLLHHAVAAGDVATLLAEAPDEARRCAASGAHRQAAAWFEKVLEHDSRLDATVKAQILYEYAAELHRLKRLEDAARAAEASIAAWTGQENATGLGRALIELARNQHFLGQSDAAFESTRRAIEVLEAGGQDDALASAYSSFAALHVWRHDMATALPWGEKARRLAAAIDRPEILSHALNYLGVAKVLTGDSTGFADLTEAVAIAERIGHAEFHARASNNLATAMFSQLRYAEGVELLATAVERAAEAELFNLEINMRGLLGQGLLMLGQWDQAEAELRPLVARSSDDLVSAPSFGYLGRLLMRRGLEEGDELIDRGLAVPGVRESLLRFGAVAAAAIERAWFTGDTATLDELRLHVGALAEAAGALDWVGTVTMYAARAGLDVTVPDPCPPAYLHVIEGHPELAVEAWEQVGDPYERAIELVRTGDRERALEGIAVFDELGAVRAAEWARERLAGIASK